VHAQPPFIIFTITSKVAVYVLLLSGQIHQPCFISSKNMYSVICIVDSSWPGRGESWWRRLELDPQPGGRQANRIYIYKAEAFWSSLPRCYPFFYKFRRNERPSFSIVCVTREGVTMYLTILEFQVREV
jgi:hypothetical protein